MALEIQRANDDQVVMQYSPLTRGLVYLLSSLKENTFIPLTETGALKRAYCHHLVRAMRWRNYQEYTVELIKNIHKQNDYAPLGLVRAKAVELGYAVEIGKRIEIAERGLSVDLTASKIYHEAVHPDILSTINDAEAAFSRTQLPNPSVFLQYISAAGEDGCPASQMVNRILQAKRTPLQRNGTLSNVIDPLLLKPLIEYGLLATLEDGPVLPNKATLRATPLYDLTVKIIAKNI